MSLVNQIPTIAIGAISPDQKAKLISIENDGVYVGFGKDYTNVCKLNFSDCETLWGV
jgi:thiamine monophosphate synthase